MASPPRTGDPPFAVPLASSDHHARANEMPARTLIVTAGISVVSLSLLAGGCSPPRPPAQAPPPMVKVVRVEQKDVPVYGEWIGTLDGMVNADIRAQVSGYLLTRHYTEGSLVKKGQLLFALDPPAVRSSARPGKRPARSGQRAGAAGGGEPGQDPARCRSLYPVSQSESRHRAGSRQRRPGQSRRQGPGRGGEGGASWQPRPTRRDRGAQSGVSRTSFAD